VLPKGDRRRRQSWIDALVNVKPPLLALLEVSPTALVDRPQKAIARAAEVSPAASVDPPQEAIKLGDWVKVTRKPRLAYGVKRGEIFQVLRVNSNGILVIENPHKNPTYILSARLGFLDPPEVCLVPRSNRSDTPAFIDVVSRNFPDRLQELLQNPSGVDRTQKLIEQATEKSLDIDRAQESLAQATKTSPGVEAEHVQDLPIESMFGRIAYPQLAQEPIAQNEEARAHLDRAQSADVHSRRSHPAKSDRDIPLLSLSGLKN